MKVSKIKSNFIIEDVRFNAGYYLNNDAFNSMKLESNKDKCISLEETANVWNPPIFKRQFCKKTDKSIPYCQSSDVANLLEGSDIYIYKEQAIKVNSIVKENQILVTGFGTIGTTRLVNELSTGISYANNVCRIEVNEKLPFGYIYAFLTSKYGRSQLNKNASGSVVRYIEAPGIKKTLIPLFSEEKQQQIHQLIAETSELRVKANRLLQETENFLKDNLDLPNLDKDDYEYFGNHTVGREVSAFIRKSKEISPISINAFNYSKRIEKITATIKKSNYLNLDDCLSENKFFSTGSFRRLEVNSSNGVKLLNQSDIFDIHKKGKTLSRRFVGNAKLVEYGEVLIAGVGTLGEGETFCRAIFTNEELEGQLISGEFIRMKTNEKIPSGYLFAWLNSDYGFRLIRSTQTGTKLCRPIQNLLAKIPVPLMDREQMNYIDKNVREAHTDFYKAIVKENQAIALIEKEIDLWQVS